MAEVEFHLHNEVGIKFPPLRPAYSDGELYFGRFRGLVARSTGTSVIGEGGTGRIHLARDELMEREVALKIPLESILRDPAAREDVIQETRQAMDLTHPNIVRIHDFHEGGGRWGISMQYVRGKNLDEWRYDAETTGFRRVIRPYTVEVIRDWIAQLCDALRYAHEDARMVHRDIKPKNLMLEKREGGEKVFITDFGISQRLRLHTMMLSRDQSKAGESKGNMGTLPYMPWEQIAGAPASPLDDVYAVGATIYELITGRPPFYDGGFEQIKVQIRETPPPSMEQRILDLGLHMPPPPEEWEEVVAACLAKRPEDRPPSMRALAAALGFQTGNNTELEARVSSQADRINQLETQIISISHATAPVTTVVNAEAEARLAAARQELAEAQAQAADSRQELQRKADQVEAAQRELEAVRAQAEEARQETAAIRAQVEEARQETAAIRAQPGEAPREAAAGRGQAEEANQETAERAKQLEAAQEEMRRLEAQIATARQLEHDLTERLAATESERDTALQGGDQALRKFQEESARRIAQGEERVAALQGELAAARADSETLANQARQQAQQRIAELEAQLAKVSNEAGQSLQKARQESEQALQKLRLESEQALQKVRQESALALQQATEQSEQAHQQATREAAKAAKAATEQLSRELEQANERSRKAEESRDKAVAQAREEGEKRLLKQTQELEQTRQSLNKLVDQKERLEREVATERERQGASLKPLLISLLVAVVLGLGGGFAISLVTGAKADGGLTAAQQSYLPKRDAVAATPVPYDLFESYAAAVGVKDVKQHFGATRADDGTVRGVNGLAALNFCNWLTEQQRQQGGLDATLHYTLPELAELKDLVASGTREWSQEWAQGKSGQVLTMWGRDGTEAPSAYQVHSLHSEQGFTFRIALKGVPEAVRSTK